MRPTYLHFERHNSLVRKLESVTCIKPLTNGIVVLSNHEISQKTKPKHMIRVYGKWTLAHVTEQWVMQCAEQWYRAFLSERVNSSSKWMSLKPPWNDIYSVSSRTDRTILTEQYDATRRQMDFKHNRTCSCIVFATVWRPSFVTHPPIAGKTPTGMCYTIRINFNCWNSLRERNISTKSINENIIFLRWEFP